jgi:hypothetical protein
VLGLAAPKPLRREGLTASTGLAKELHDPGGPPLDSRSVIQGVRVLSVVKVSIVFYLILAGVLVAAAMVLWWVAHLTGTLQSVERSAHTLLDLKSVTVRPGTIATYGAGAGLALAVVGVGINALAAVIYNLITAMVGGIALDSVDDL